MLDRLLILLLVAVLVAGGWVLFRLWRAARLRRLRSSKPLASIVPPGRPAVVGFSAPHCTECHTRQAPALARLASMLGDAVVIRQTSALDHPELVRELGILTVPATVVVDANGRVRHLNLGFSNERKLHAQVRAVIAA